MRTKGSHNRHCKRLEQEDISTSERTHYSTTYGINRWSSLAKLEPFNVVEQLPEDVMHILLEGVCMKQTIVLLNHLILERRLMSLSQLNIKLASYPYQYFETDKPATISALSLRTCELAGKQSGKNCMRIYCYYTLVIVLPFTCKPYIML